MDGVRLFDAFERPSSMTSQRMGAHGSKVRIPSLGSCAAADAAAGVAKMDFTHASQPMQSARRASEAGSSALGTSCLASARVVASKRHASGGNAASGGGRLAPTSGKTWRQEQATQQHAARIQRSCSEGSLRKPPGTSKPSTALRKMQKAGLEWFDDRVGLGALGRLPDSNKPFDIGFGQADLATPRSAAAATTPIATPRDSAAPRRSNSQASLVGRPRPAASCEPRKGGSEGFPPAGVEVEAKVGSERRPSDVGKRSTAIFAEVSSLVDELEAARGRALASGGKLPRAVEAAASALEPLLRLRDVTGGGFAFDVAQMPWLPQLLSVFRTVLHTAVIGVGAKARAGTGEDESAPNADVPGGMDGAAATAAAAAAAMVALGGSSGGTESTIDTVTGPVVSELALECEMLRARVRQQDEELDRAQEMAQRLQRKVDELQCERDELLRSVKHLEQMAYTGVGGCSSGDRRDSDTGVAPAGCEWMLKRMTDMDVENHAFRAETRDAEERMGELAALIQGALEDDSRRPSAVMLQRTPTGGRDDGDAQRETVPRKGGSTTPRSGGMNPYPRARKSLTQPPGPRDLCCAAGDEASETGSDDELFESDD